MSYRTQPAQRYEKITSFASDNTVNARAAYPVGGTQFVFTCKDGTQVTVPSTDYDTFFKQPCEVVTIKAATDCTEVHIWV